jgi:hypothetical protein
MTFRRCIALTLLIPVLTILLAHSVGEAGTTGTARFPPGVCPQGSPIVGDIGLLYLQCVGDTCSVDRRASIRSGSPADGALFPGDVVLAVDGVPLASRFGGARLANLAPGKPVTLRIRRGGEEKDVVLTPTAGCKGPQIARR